MDYLKKHRKIILAAISLVLFIIVAKTALIDGLVFYDQIAQLETYCAQFRDL